MTRKITIVFNLLSLIFIGCASKDEIFLNSNCGCCIKFDSEKIRIIAKKSREESNGDNYELLVLKLKDNTVMNEIITNDKKSSFRKFPLKSEVIYDPELLEYTTHIKNGFYRLSNVSKDGSYHICVIDTDSNRIIVFSTVR